MKQTKLFLIATMLMCSMGAWAQNKLYSYLIKDGKQKVVLQINIPTSPERPDLERECYRYFFSDSISDNINDAMSKLLSRYEKVDVISSKEAISYPMEKNYGFIGYRMDIYSFQNIGDCQTFQLIQTRKGKDITKVKKTIRTVVYDYRLDKVLTFDDIFIPTVAATMKEKTQGQLINMHILQNALQCGTETIKFIENESKFTDEFKQSIIYADLIAKKEETMRMGKELEQQDAKQQFDELLAKAKAGDAQAQYEAGLAYLNGTDVSADNTLALSWISAAAEHGHINAMFHMGKFYEEGNVVEADKEQAFKYYQQAAEHGHIKGMRIVFQMYKKGDGVEKDSLKASFWENKLDSLEKADDRIYEVPEESAEFPGDIYAWLNNNIIYPPKSYKNNIQGRVSVSFVIDKDGSVTEVKVFCSPDEDLSAEAVRVVKEMPKWKPARNNGHLVKMRYLLPILFRKT